MLQSQAILGLLPRSEFDSHLLHYSGGMCAAMHVSPKN